ncbi:hypothetical protein [Pseudomonas sp.]|uniref:hypothetical protein n=1 Tax=Pseudomonas sp. TaxID=306 RepID=UPI00261CA219|nr:hypothetical protein [Pseudomonas sp.]
MTAPRIFLYAIIGLILSAGIFALNLLFLAKPLYALYADLFQLGQLYQGETRALMYNRFLLNFIAPGSLLTGGILTWLLMKRRQDNSAEHIFTQAIAAELKPLRPIYPMRELSIPVQPGTYPSVISLEAHGCGAYLLNAHVTAEAISLLEQRIAELGLLDPMQNDNFQTYRQGPEAVSLQTEALGEGFSLLLVSNSTRLLQLLPDLAPPPPWRAFPEVDASGLGSLQGSLEYWWQRYWWPYWQSLTQEQRNGWLQNPAHPEGWRDYVRLQDELNGTREEPQK